MKQVVQNFKTGKIRLVEVPEPLPRRGGMVVENRASLISSGTERMSLEFAQKSLLGKARERPDLVRQVLTKLKRDGIIPTIEAVRGRLEEELPLGYSSSGVVREVGENCPDFQPGDRVACAGLGYASHSEVVFVPKNLAVKLPSSLSFEEGAFVSLGAIALHSLRVGELAIGEKVAVIGLGLIGQLVSTIAKVSSSFVFGVDLDENRVKLAKEMGADLALPSSHPNLKEEALSATKGRGFDLVIVAASGESGEPLRLAGEIARDKGRVVVVGAIKVEAPRRLYYQKELELRFSRSYGPGRYDPLYEEKGIDYPIAYVPFTERRNMETFLNLIASGKIKLTPLISHRFSIEDAEKAYKLLLSPRKKPLGIILSYPEKKKPSFFVELGKKAEPRKKKGKIGVGLIGGGSFARSVLLPHLSRIKGIELIGLAVRTGAKAEAMANKYRFHYLTTDYKRVLSDPDIEAVVIATRHKDHPEMAAEALSKGKAVFLEKPLAIDEEGLSLLKKAHEKSEGKLMVGFNRRFSPFSLALKEFFKQRSYPLAISYRVNAGAVPKDHWIQDEEEGGGRIIGEVCHFIDLISFIIGSTPQKVTAFALPTSNTPPDTLSIILGFADGSIGNINYFATGDPSLPKEHIEVMGGGKTGVIEDFRSLLLSSSEKRIKKVRRWGKEKGFSEELLAFFRFLKEGGSPPTPFSWLIATTKTTFAIEESLRRGKVIYLDETTD